MNKLTLVTSEPDYYNKNVTQRHVNFDLIARVDIVNGKTQSGESIEAIRVFVSGTEFPYYFRKSDELLQKFINRDHLESLTALRYFHKAGSSKSE